MSTPFNIQQRTFNFGVTVVNFCRELTAAHPVTRRVGWQLLDAATSIGANMEEADAAQSHRDFVAKAAIARFTERPSHATDQTGARVDDTRRARCSSYH